MPEFDRSIPPPTPAPLYRTVRLCVSKGRGAVCIPPRQTATGGFGVVKAAIRLIRTAKASN